MITITLNKKKYYGADICGKYKGEEITVDELVKIISLKDYVTLKNCTIKDCNNIKKYVNNIRYLELY